MPSYAIHLAVAKRYLQKNRSEIKNPTDFYDGNIIVDLTDNKMKTHYSIAATCDDIILNAKNKVDINKVLQLKIDTDLEKGIFLHLLTDYVFYNYYFTKDFVKDTTYAEFSKNLYASYNFVNKWLADKYKITYDDTSFAAEMNSKVFELYNKHPEISKSNTNVLSDLGKLSRFIEFVSNFNLQEIKQLQNLGDINF